MLFFIHIPKTAGTSVRFTLERAIRPRIVQVYRNAEPEWDPGAVVKRELAADSILFGHFSWGFHEKFGAPPRYATVLRDPVERVVSWYNYMGSHENSGLYDRIRDGLSLKAVVEGGDHEVSNRMVAMIAGRVPRSIDDAETLQRAADNLRTFEFVSVQSELHLEQDRICHLVSGMCGPVPRANASTFRTKVDAETLEAIRRRNALDLELYAIALHLTGAQQQDFARSAPRVGLAAW